MLGRSQAVQGSKAIRLSSCEASFHGSLCLPPRIRKYHSVHGYRHRVSYVSFGRGKLPQRVPTVQYCAQSASASQSGVGQCHLNETHSRSARQARVLFVATDHQVCAVVALSSNMLSTSRGQCQARRMCSAGCYQRQCMQQP